ncbi:GNAT family N-acetyltransferase [Aeromicrobium sp. NPDC092404]|uniref:bifunctional helix-turn-helix transcriptional regulator/GNAT family N-acetyltransferase n=1 Tax=Aeromicrobium sp. NPDC092404 TaxID=3154976 RepID=UPI003415F03E
MVDDAVATLRRFNRSWSQRVGVLDESFLGSGRSLGPVRLLFELRGQDTSVRELRERLDLDSGYLSRLLRQLEADGLITVTPDPTDGRRRIAALTERGRAEQQDLDDRSDVLAHQLVDVLSERQRARLAECLDQAERLVRAATVSLDLVHPGSEHARTAVAAYFRELDETFDGGFDAAAGADDEHALAGATGRFVVAVSGGAVVGCGGLQSLSDDIGEIKRMWVHRDWRGSGLAGRLLRRLEDESRALGHRVVRLDTNSSLAAALAMYRAAGYVEIPRYNDNPYPDHWFEKSL